jgi:uncharacterized protein YkwD
MTTSARRLATLLALITALVAYAAPAQAFSSSNSLAQVLNASRAVQRQPALPVSQALASPQAKMYAAMNAARTRSGLPAASISRILTIASTRYAQALANHHLFQHASKIRTSNRFSVVGEILARSPGRSPSIDPVVNAWLDSPIHRPILLGGQYQSVGLGMAEARYGGKWWTVWVVRFGQR